MGKGSKTRPLAVKREIFDDNHDQINWPSKQKHKQEEQVKKETKDDNTSK